MIGRLSFAIASTLALAACGGAKEEPALSEADKTKSALETTSKPFSIGNTAINEMGAAPPGELDDGIKDPYERMAKREAASQPAN